MARSRRQGRGARKGRGTVVVGVEVREKVSDREVPGMAEGVDEEAGARDERGGRHRGRDGRERRGGGGGDG